MRNLDLILAILAASAVLAMWAYSRAFRVHNLIEEIRPGFNERMRRTCSWLRRHGMKK